MDNETLMLTALKEKNIPVKKAVEVLEVSKQTFYNKIKSSKPDAQFWTNVKNKLHIDIDYTQSANSDQIASTNDELAVNKGIPMYNVPGSAGGVEVYTDPESAKIVGYINFPGITKGSFALPIYGNSMNPTLESGSWAVCRPIENKFSINWGHVYYIEYHDYRVFKRLLATDNDNEVILWSDNQAELVNGRPKFAPNIIQKSEIRRLCLVTDVYKKSNH